MYAVIVVMSVIYAIGFMAYARAILNLRPFDTIRLPPGAPGTLQTEVYSSARFWLAMFLLPFKGLFIVFFFLAIAWAQKIACCSWTWMVLMVLVTLADGVSFSALAVEAARANQAGQRGNMFNGFLYCCVHGTNDWRVSGCASDTKCHSPIDRRPDIVGQVTQEHLRWDPNSKWLFHAGWAFLAFQVIFYAMLFGSICWEPTLLPRARDPFDPMQTPSAASAAPFKQPPSTSVGAALEAGQHGVVKRAIHRN